MKSIAIHVADRDSSLHHNLVHEFWMAEQFKFAFSSESDIAAEHGTPRHSVLVEDKVTIIDAIVAQHLSKITDFHSLERLVCIQIPDRDEE